MTNKAQFDKRACDLYISHVVNLLVTYPLIFDVSNGGVSKQNSQKLMFMVSFQFHYLMMSAQKALKPSMTLWPKKNYINISKTMHPTTSTTSFEGKVADVVISDKSDKLTGSKCLNCKLSHGSYKNCKLPCSLCPGKPPHKFFNKHICNTYLSWKAKKQKDGTWQEIKSAYNATSTTDLPAPIQSDVHAELNSLKQHYFKVFQLYFRYVINVFYLIVVVIPLFSLHLLVLMIISYIGIMRNL